MIDAVSMLIQLRSSRFVALLASLLLLLLAAPLTEDWELGGIIFNLFLSLTLLAGIFAITHHNALLLGGTVLAAGTFLSNWLFLALDLLPIGILAALLGLVYFAYTAGVILAHLMATRQITINELAAAVSTYLLLGLSGALIFRLLDEFTADALINTVGGAADGGAIDPLHLSDYIYFSFVALTTLGFGDLLPGTPMARVFAYLEAVIGQVYLTVLVARLVGMHISQPRP